MVNPSPHETIADEKEEAGDGRAWRQQARELIADLFERSPTVYWVDLLASAIGAWGSVALVLASPTGSLPQVLAFVVAGVLFFRAGTFIHEIVHMPAPQMVWFKRTWNLLVGVPLLMPWILYRNHAEHHNHHQFGTPADGEYLPLASAPLRETVKYLAQAPLLPLFMILRFGVVGPLSWLHRGLREWTLTHVSAAVSNPYYRKRFPPRDERHLAIVEVLCFLWLVALAIAAWRGAIPGRVLVTAYLLLAFTLSLNWVRNLAAHRYANDGRRMTMQQQVEDSINITGQTWLTVLMFPVGLRFHALHHMFPALPYHAMGEAHRRLLAHLPADSPYRATSRESFFEVVGDLWRAARNTHRRDSSMPAWAPRSGRP
jgi:fatty acid desaturase